ncbi:hypothetical protein PHYPSEUDO_008613 [Phytophthora pseudosyringae]|uniref:Uncharacterized protein n=1 Tax=Phytophthora pseudosyringae TaxID=221518 RepID=A0A8T1WEZ1_9STRA|nr:hypothetical protein PHYPSEUDO_008613 [Phytophthora pseudosyringae]
MHGNIRKATNRSSTVRRACDEASYLGDKSAGLSGSDEKETPFIQVMTGVVSKLDDHLRAQAKVATAAAEVVKAKTNSGDVVRTAALSRIQLGKRRLYVTEKDKEGDDLGGQGESNQLGRSKRQHTRNTADFKGIFEEMKSEQAKMLSNFMQNTFGVADLIHKLLRRCYESTSPWTQRHRVPAI